MDFAFADRIFFLKQRRGKLTELTRELQRGRRIQDWLDPSYLTLPGLSSAPSRNSTPNVFRSALGLAHLGSIASDADSNGSRAKNGRSSERSMSAGTPKGRLSASAMSAMDRFPSINDNTPTVKTDVFVSPAKLRLTGMGKRVSESHGAIGSGAATVAASPLFFAAKAKTRSER
jgi:hypothetical protein